METIEWTRIFVKVVQLGSFTRAATELKLPKSTVSKVIAKLESQTGTKLLVRTTRSQALTPAGRIFFDSCVGPVQQIEDAQKSLYGQDNIFSGTVRITAPEDIGSLIMAPIIADFSRSHRELRFELNYTNQIINLVKDGYDLAIRIGHLRSSGLYQKKIGSIHFVLVSSEAYLKNSPAIKTIDDLTKSSCIGIESAVGLTTWTLENNKHSRKIKIEPKVVSNQPTSVLKIVESGAGVSLLPKFLVKDKLADGSLVQILQSWSSSGLPVSLVSPLSMAKTPRVKVIADVISDKLRLALDS